MEELRRRRLLARKIVQEMDSTFKIVAFLSLFANVPLIVFIVYALVLHGPKSEFLLVIGVIVTLLALAQVGFVVVAAAWINKWVSSYPCIKSTPSAHTRTNIIFQSWIVTHRAKVWSIFGQTIGILLNTLAVSSTCIV